MAVEKLQGWRFHGFSGKPGNVAVPLKWKIHSWWLAKIKPTVLTPKLQAPTYFVLWYTVLWKLLKLNSTVEELPAVFFPVVNLKHSTWSEEIKSTIFPTDGPWFSWAAFTEPHSHLTGRLLHFHEQSGNFSWRDYWKVAVHCWGFLSFGQKPCPLQCAECWQFTHILLIASVCEKEHNFSL